MRIQLDTTAKTITVDENVKLQDLFLLLEKILPKEQWKKFTLQANTTINNWSHSTYIDRYVPSPWNNPYPFTYPWVTYCNNTTGVAVSGSGSSLTNATNSSIASASPHDITLTAGVFNIEG